MASLTLAQQLAQLNDPAPVDIDPEDVYTRINDKGEAMEEDVENLALNLDREHYLLVGSSSLRTPLDELSHTKYAGEKIARPLGVDAESSEGDEGSSDESSIYSNDDSGEGEEGHEGGGSTNGISDGEIDHTKESYGEALEETLKARREADLLKGKAVIRQLAVWDALVDSRIRLQKSVSLCNILPMATELSLMASSEDIKQHTSQFLQEALLLSADLLTLRQAMLPDIVTSETQDANPPRKRRKLNTSSSPSVESELIDATLDAILLDHGYYADLLRILNMWSSKVQAVLPSTRQSSARGAYKKSAVDLIRESLTDRDRAVTRTRLRRGPPRIHAPSNEVNDETATEQEVQIFDDNDFYQQLLRDVIDGARMADLGAGDLNQRPKKIKKEVDTKASKGRKLRYEVHDKIQNFMVPVPNNNEWHEEKIDELFSSLLGKASAVSNNDMEMHSSNELHAAVDSAISSGGFRVFG